MFCVYITVVVVWICASPCFFNFVYYSCFLLSAVFWNENYNFNERTSRWRQSCFLPLFILVLSTSLRHLPWKLLIYSAPSSAFFTFHTLEGIFKKQKEKKGNENFSQNYFMAFIVGTLEGTFTASRHSLARSLAGRACGESGWKKFYIFAIKRNIINTLSQPEWMKRMAKQPASSGNSYLKKVFIITFLARRASIETLFMETSASRSTIGENKTFF